MQWTTRGLGVVVFVLWALPVAVGQQSEDVLTNADVVTLTDDGLPATVIVDRIAAMRTDFDTSVDQLVALLEAGVEAGVLEAMIASGSRDVPGGAAPSGGMPAVAGDTRAGGASRAGEADAGAPGTVFRDCDGCPQMVVIPAGTFRDGLRVVEGVLWGPRGDDGAAVRAVEV